MYFERSFTTSCWLAFVPASIFVLLGISQLIESAWFEAAECFAIAVIIVGGVFHVVPMDLAFKALGAVTFMWFMFHTGDQFVEESKQRYETAFEAPRRMILRHEDPMKGYTLMVNCMQEQAQAEQRLLFAGYLLTLPEWLSPIASRAVEPTLAADPAKCPRIK